MLVGIKDWKGIFGKGGGHDRKRSCRGVVIAPGMVIIGSMVSRRDITSQGKSTSYIIGYCTLIELKCDLILVGVIMNVIDRSEDRESR